ncbi:unnamed protein product [Clonostachys rosea f. rosea IK726]|uniref:Uncharacterized protein n=1 Tax=Clonostachys rosea f. rosea IK726 TaxID=1349383 RepID=A0ACA9UPN9_BIOOC|nr:unnamed protein product [Clonostachys rosea f. rosea IK726]
MTFLRLGEQNSTQPRESKSSTDQQMIDIEKDAIEEIQQMGGYWPWIKTFSIFWKFMWPAEKNAQNKLVFATLVAVVASYLEYLSQMKLGELFGILQNVKGSGLTIGKPAFKVFTYYGVLILVLPITRYSCSLEQSKLDGDRRQNLRSAAYKQIMQLDRKYHSHISSGQFKDAVDKALGLVTLFNSLLLDLIPRSITLAFASARLYSMYSPWVRLLMFCGFLLSMVLEHRSFSSAVPKAEKANRQYYIQESQQRNGLQGWRTVTNFSRKDDEVKQYQKEIHTWSELLESYYSTTSMFECLQNTMNHCLLLFAYYTIMCGVLKDSDQMDHFIAFKGLLFTLLGNTSFFASYPRTVVRTLFDANPLRKIMELRIEKDEGDTLKVTEGEIVYENVSFSYPGREKKVIDGLNLTIAGGSHVALLGPTGIGKSTVVNVLFREGELSNGVVKVDGKDITKVSKESLYYSLGLMEQMPVYFERSAREIIAYGKPHATDSEILEACRKACIDELIMSWADGLSTKIRKDTCSGGELQRIGLACVFLKKPAIMCIDEGTSAIDSITEACLRAHVAEFSSTLIVITHRLSNAVKMDRIVYFGDGCKILEDGKHEELLRLNGHYAKAWRINMGKERPDDLKKESR